MTEPAPIGELEAITERVDVTSGLPRIDPNWTYTDQQGHDHYYSMDVEDHYPTLVSVPDGEPYYCRTCDEVHQDHRYECLICHEVIRPGKIGPSGYREYRPGLTAYYLDGEPISPERFRELWAARQAAMEGETR